MLYRSSQVDEPDPQAWHRDVGFEECGIIAGINKGLGESLFSQAAFVSRLVIASVTSSLKSL